MSAGQLPRGPPCLGGEKQRLVLKENRGEAPMPNRLLPPSSPPSVDSSQCGARTPSPAPCSGHSGGSNFEVSISLSLASFCSSRKGNLGLIIELRTRAHVRPLLPSSPRSGCDLKTLTLRKAPAEGLRRPSVGAPPRRPHTPGRTRAGNKSLAGLTGEVSG